MTQINTLPDHVHTTSFGKYVPGDLAHYKNLKRLHHLYIQYVAPWAFRWDRAQFRLEHNRRFRIRRARLQAQGSWVCPLYWSINENVTRSLSHQSTITRDVICTTQLLDDLQYDYFTARTPQDTPHAVQALRLSPGQLAQLLADTEKWVAEHRAEVERLVQEFPKWSGNK